MSPSYARGWYLSGAVRVDLGDPEGAIEHVTMSLRLSPRARMSAHFSVLGTAHLFAGRFKDALHNLLLAVQEHPQHPWPYRLLAACYAHMGQLEEAREIVARLRFFNPVVLPRSLSYRRRADCEALLSGLRLAVGENI